MNKIIFIYKLLIPEFIRDIMYERRERKRKSKIDKKTIQKDILNYIKSIDHRDPEISKIFKFLSNHPLKTFPLNISTKKNIDLRKEENMYYVIFENKKLFFPRGTTKKTIIKYCKGIFEEQHPNSPHCYLSEKFNVNENSIIADIGAAEGNFTLSIIDKVKKVYIFEADNVWTKALKKTFEPWQDKVEFVFAKVSDNNQKGYISLDEFFKDKPFPDFLKLDVEGSENCVLKGAENIINQDNIKVAICTYHRYEDEKNFKTYFDTKGYKTHFSNSYMIMYENGEDFKEPYIRRGVLRAEKSKIN